MNMKNIHCYCIIRATPIMTLNNSNNNNDNNNNNKDDDDNNDDCDDDDNNNNNSSNNFSNNNDNNNRIERRNSRFLQSHHYAVNRLQHVRSSGPGATVCKSHATHRALITCNLHCATW